MKGRSLCHTLSHVEPVIEVRDLHKSYQDTGVVRGVSFDVDRGEIYGLLGRNGAGKTTTVEIIQGLRSRDAGLVSVLGLDPTKSPAELRKRIGSQLQSSALPGRIRVREAIGLFASFADNPVATEELLAEWDLTHLARRPFAKLSGGERQRVFLALALVNRPEVVFLDELTTGLDPVARRQTWSLVEKVRTQGTTVVLVTHFMEEAERLCDRLAIVSAGRIVAQGTPQQLREAAGADTEIRFTANGQSLAFLGLLGSVERVTKRSGTVVVTGDRTAPFEVAAALRDHGITPDDFQTNQVTLEDAFLSLTKEQQ